MMIYRLIIFSFITSNLLISLPLFAQISSVQEYDSLFSRLSELSEEKKLQAFILLGKYQRNKNPKTGIDLLNKALVIAKKLNRTKENVDITRLLGSCYDSKNMYTKALKMYRISLNKARNIGDSLLIAKALHNIAFTYFKKEEYELSIKYHLENIKVEEKINDKEGLGYTYNHLGLIYGELKDYKKADSCLLIAVKVREQINDLEGLGWTYMNLISSYTRRKKYNLSLKYAEKSLEINKVLGDTIAYAGALNEKGNILWYLNKEKEASKYYKKALDLYILKKDWDGVVSEYRNLSLVARKLKNVKQSEDYILKAKEIAKKNKITAHQTWMSIYGDLYTLAYEQKNYEKALTYLTKHYEEKELLADRTSKEKISDLESIYNLEKKEAELSLVNEENDSLKLQRKLNFYITVFIVLGLFTIILFSFYVNRLRLKKNKIIQDKNTALEEKNENLKSANEELNRFVYTVSHDLKSPIASVKGLVEVIRLHKVSPTIEQYLSLQEKSLSKLELFIQESLDYAKSSKKGLQFEKVSLLSLVNEILERIEHDLDSQNVKKEVLIEDELEVYSDYERLKSILHNLITNSIRYRNQTINNSFVKIYASNQDNKTLLKIEDNGIGISEEVRQKIFEKFYRANKQIEGTGLGLAIVKENVEKLNGKIHVVSEVGNGSTFEIMIPKSEVV